LTIQSNDRKSIASSQFVTSVQRLHITPWMLHYFSSMFQREDISLVRFFQLFRFRQMDPTFVLFSRLQSSFLIGSWTRPLKMFNSTFQLVSSL